MCRMAVPPHMIERQAGCHMANVNAIRPGGHRARDAELREAWVECTGLDAGRIFGVNLEKRKGSACLAVTCR